MTAGAHVRSVIDGGTAVVTLDDGKVNAITETLLDAVDAALDDALAADAAVVLAGRPARFSAGFDLATLGAGGPPAARLVRRGFELAERLLSYPRPVVAACTGHAFAMGAFLLLASDHRVGAAGAHTITANEVAIGLTMPQPALALCRFRLAPTPLHRVVAQSERLGPVDAVTAGFLDEVAPPGAVPHRAIDTATALSRLDPAAFAATKLRLNAAVLAAVRDGIDQELSELRDLSR